MEGKLSDRDAFSFARTIVPKLARDPELLASAETQIEGQLDAVADLLLVSIVAGAIEMAIPLSDRAHTVAGTVLLRNLPETEADGGDARNRQGRTGGLEEQERGAGGTKNENDTSTRDVLFVSCTSIWQ